MAAIFIAATMVIAEKVAGKKQARKDKKSRDDVRYQELQTETKQRIVRTQSGNTIAADLLDAKKIRDGARSPGGEAPPP
ncbi:hypothetical protein LTR36_006234, partial [Oleoguttula mirabilis]